MPYEINYLGQALEFPDEQAALSFLQEAGVAQPQSGGGLSNATNIVKNVVKYASPMGPMIDQNVNFVSELVQNPGATLQAIPQGFANAITLGGLGALEQATGVTNTQQELQQQAPTAYGAGGQLGFMAPGGLPNLLFRMAGKSSPAVGAANILAGQAQMPVDASAEERLQRGAIDLAAGLGSQAVVNKLTPGKNIQKAENTVSKYLGLKEGQRSEARAIVNQNMVQGSNRAEVLQNARSAKDEAGQALAAIYKNNPATKKFSEITPAAADDVVKLLEGALKTESVQVADPAQRILAGAVGKIETGKPLSQPELWRVARAIDSTNFNAQGQPIKGDQAKYKSTVSKQIREYLYNSNKSNPDLKNLNERYHAANLVERSVAKKGGKDPTFLDEVRAMTVLPGLGAMATGTVFGPTVGAAVGTSLAAQRGVEQAAKSPGFVSKSADIFKAFEGMANNLNLPQYQQYLPMLLESLRQNTKVPSE